MIALVRSFRRAFAEAWPRGTAATPRNLTESMSLELRVIADRLPQIGAETALGHRSAGDVIALVSTLEVLTTYLAMLEDVAHRLATLSPGPEITVALEAARARTLRAFDAALGEAPPASSVSEASELDAALSVAMGKADEAETRRIMPIVADLSQLLGGGAASAGRPWRYRRGDRPAHAPARGAQGGGLRRGFSTSRADAPAAAGRDRDRPAGPDAAGAASAA